MAEGQGVAVHGADAGEGEGVPRRRGTHRAPADKIEGRLERRSQVTASQPGCPRGMDQRDVLER